MDLRKLITGLFIIVTAYSMAQCTTQLLHDDYSNASLWNSVVTYPGEIDISGGTLNYTNLEGAAYNRVYRALPSVLPDTYWNATCDFMPVSGNGPAHYVMAFTAGTLDPISYDGAAGYTTTNEDAIMVYYIYQGSAPSAGCCPDPSVGPWQLVARSKKGTVLAAPSSGITVTALSQYTHVRLERVSTGLVALHAYSNSAMTTELAGSPVYYCIDPTITGLNTIHQGMITWSGYTRVLTAKIDNLDICLSQPSDTTVIEGCTGNTVALQAANLASATYAWTPAATACSSCSSANVPVPVTGTSNYSVLVTSGCASFTQYFSVQVDPACTPPLTCSITAGPDTSVCAGSTVQLTAAAGFNTYSWSPGAGLSDSTIANPIATVVDATSYVVTATSGSGSNLIYNGDFSLGNTGFTCGLNYTGSYSPGNYDVAPTFFTTSYSLGDHTSTADEMLMSVDGAPSLLTLWQQTIPAVMPSTNYVFSLWSTVSSVNPPRFEIHFIGNVTGDVIVATLTGAVGAPPPASYWIWSQVVAPPWNSGANTSVTIKIINLELNGYGNDFGLDDFAFTTTSSCIATDTVTIGINPPPLMPVTTDTAICEGGATQPLHATGTNITWYTSPGSAAGSTTSPTPTSTAVGQQSFYATQTINGCESDTATMHVDILAGPPVFTLDPSQPPCSQKTKEIGPVNPAWYYLWNDGSTVSPYTATASGTYVLTASNNCGSSTDSVTLVFEECHCYFYIPNAFTPNGNATNDLFRPKHDCDFGTYDMAIYNRWGEKIFETKDPLEGWDGNYMGRPAEPGVYVVHISYTALAASGFLEPKTWLSSVTLVR